MTFSTVLPSHGYAVSGDGGADTGPGAPAARLFKRRLLTAKEASEFLGVRRITFYRAVAGKIPGLPPVPCVRIGRRQYFRLESLERWLAEVEQRCNEAHSKS
jgi:predicted DNA-binding transcriptional regulator AlpA